MKYFFCLAMLLIASLAVLAQQSNQDINLVRQAYAKVPFGNEATILDRGIGFTKTHAAAKNIANHAITITVFDMKSGNISDPSVDNTAYRDLVTLSNSVTLRIQVDPQDVSYSGKHYRGSSITVGSWQKVADGLSEDTARMPFAKFVGIVNENNGSNYSRYVSYSVDVSYQGQSYSYRGVGLFGNNESTILDNVLGNIGMSQLITADVYPYSLLSTHQVGLPEVKEWLNTVKVDCKGATLCLDVTGKIGVPADVVQRLLTSPAPAMIPEKRETKSSPKQSCDPDDPNCEDPPPPLVCSDNNKTQIFPVVAYDTTGHVVPGGTSKHGITTNLWDSCTYQTWTNNDCWATAKTYSDVTTPYEHGVTYGMGLGKIHEVDYIAMKQTTTGLSPTAYGGYIVEQSDCFGGVCHWGIGITAPPFSATFDGIKMWGTNAQIGTVTCPPEYTSPGSPIMFSFGGAWQLTDTEHGVHFDLSAQGHQDLIPWSAAGSDNAFLVLPDGNGKVTSGRQLFGNFTLPGLNDGFKALAYYDQPVNGGNGDGGIDQQDGIFSSLKFWTDTNHNGVVDPGELSTLASHGVMRINLFNVASGLVDQYGNKCSRLGSTNDARVRVCDWFFNITE